MGSDCEWSVSGDEGLAGSGTTAWSSPINRSSNSLTDTLGGARGSSTISLDKGSAGADVCAAASDSAWIAASCAACTGAALPLA